MTHVMIDLETFGTGKTAVIVQIGACYFDPNTGEIGDTFKVNVDADSAVKAGCKIDASTVMWWLQQSQEARDSIMTSPQIDLLTAMEQFNQFLSRAKHVWSHATFDFVIVTEVLNLLGIKPKFRYTAARDIRTLTFLSKVAKENSVREGTHHDALDDAKYQVKYCVAALRSLK